MTEGRRALRSVLFYGASIALVSVSNFLAVPILLSLIGGAEFATWALLEPILLASIPLGGLGLQFGLLRLISGTSGDRDSTAALFPVHACLSVGVGTTAGLATSLMGFDGATAFYLGITVAVEGMVLFFSTLWRGQIRPGRFALVEGGRAAILAASLAIMLWLGTGVHSAEEYFQLRAGIALGALALAILIVRPRLAPRADMALTAIRYGAPIVVASALAAFLVSIDRYAVAQFAPDLIPGYVAHMKLAQLVALVASAFYTWFGPVAIRLVNQGGERANAFLSASTSIFVLALLGVCANLFLVAPGLWPVLFPGIPLDQQLFAVQMAGTAVLAMGNPLSIGTLRHGRTHQALVVTLLAIGLGATASFALAGSFGTIGAALGRAIGLGAYTTAFAYITLRSVPLAYPWRSYGAAMVFAIAVTGTLALTLPSESWPTILTKLAIANLLLMPAFAILAIRFVRKGGGAL